MWPRNSRWSSVAKKLRITQDYALARQRAYPPVGDALDAIQKALAALDGKGGFTLPPEAKAWVEASEAVKTHIPKPAVTPGPKDANK